MAHHICPWWLGYFLINPLRKLMQNPEKILKPYIKSGMIALDIGSGMGFFSIPLAQLVGDKGKVICLDVQEKMIVSLRKRAAKAGIINRIDTRICLPGFLGIENLKDQIDFILAFSVAHEVPDITSFFHQIHHVLKKEGKLLLSEPSGHISKDKFDHTVTMAKKAGFIIDINLSINRSRSVLLEKIK